VPFVNPVKILILGLVVDVQTGPPVVVNSDVGNNAVGNIHPPVEEIRVLHGGFFFPRKRLASVYIL
jgi:hypothetical protein